MIRRTCAARNGWQDKLEAQGFKFEVREEPEYAPPTNFRDPPRLIGTRKVRDGWWNEGALYELTTAEVRNIGISTREALKMVKDTLHNALRERRFAELGVSDWLGEKARDTHPGDWPSLPAIYGRFDFVLTNDGELKLLEFNGETSTMLLESAAIQQQWAREVRPQVHQSNALTDMLVAHFGLMRRQHHISKMHFACMDNDDDRMTTMYLAEMARRAGINAVVIAMESIGWDGVSFVDESNEDINYLFKLYPWTWLERDQFADNIDHCKTMFIEPAWKALASSKGLLPLLWEQYNGHRLLLPAEIVFDVLDVRRGWVRKPMHGRQAQNITLIRPNGEVYSTNGPQEDYYIEQAYAEIAECDGYRPIIGAWIVGDEFAGIGIRECRGFITDETSQFVPHVYV